ncbi:hypothetical protein [Amycolatopsis sp. FDAARGOS 1241]|uniref:hypothetical protein n=1 Tax=Amycolatopsis sp. FDAARGOS 1241 TaxID=2778070 RepID=UPI0019517179|nr:hypothetical protein [Amycolatopsis sp. FDAARGOS 1241]QRP42979.1 hypothetical protein I6J71_26400 [Amycolatopsis sp. FDAARGOS 1241]
MSTSPRTPPNAAAEPDGGLLGVLAAQIKLVTALLAVAPGTAEIPVMMTVLADTTARAHPLLRAHAPHVPALLAQAQQHALGLRDDAARSDLIAAHGHLRTMLRRTDDNDSTKNKALELDFSPGDPSE